MFCVLLVIKRCYMVKKYFFVAVFILFSIPSALYGRNVSLPVVSELFQDSVRQVFVNGERNRLHNSKQLHGLAIKLQKTAATAARVVRFIHIGDSHLQADMMSKVLREGLHSRYGNAGRGLIFPYQLARSNAPSDVMATSGVPWNYSRLTELKPKIDCGVCGYAIKTDSLQASLSIGLRYARIDDDGFDMVRLFVGNTTGCIDIGTSGYRKETVCLEPEDVNGKLMVDVGGKTRNISIAKSATDSTGLVFYGVSFENKNATGVLYHTIGVNGADFDSYLRTPLFWQQLPFLQADCYIISLGTNDAQNQQLNPDEFSYRVNTMVSKLRETSPGAVIILTTPPVSYYRRNYPNPVLKTVSEEICRLGNTKNICTWDLYSILGGFSGAELFRRTGLLRPDLVHFSKQAYQLQGEMLLKALLDAIDEQNRDHH